MAIFPSTAIPSAAGDYEIDYSCRFNLADSARLSWTPSGSGDSLTAWTFSCWYKRGKLGGDQGLFCNAASDLADISFDANGSISFYTHNGVAYVGKIQTSSAYHRDPSAWYNLVCVWDTGNATGGDRIRAYMNGVRITSWGATTEPAEDAASALFNTAIEHQIGKRLASSGWFEGYLAEMQFIDGAALTPASFGESGDYGEWKPIKYTGSYGTNGFHLDFADSAALGNDVSGNDNDWTVTNLVASDQMLDTPTNNFATMNPLDSYFNYLKEGNLEVIHDSTSWRAARGTLAPSTGKWYYEAHIETVTTWAHIGVCNVETENGGKIQDLPGSWWYRTDGSTSANEGSNDNASLTAPSDDDIIQVAYDMDAGKIWFGVNNTWVLSGDPAAGSDEVYSGLSGNLAPALAMYYQVDPITMNFGQDSSFAGEKTSGSAAASDGNEIGDFYYAPPTDFLALCTSNLPDVAVTPSEHFNTILYTGDGTDEGAGGQPQTGVGFQPDFVWIKCRSGATDHFLHDAIRGVNQRIKSNSSDAEYDDNNALLAFGSDGFTVADDAATGADTSTYVAWNWKANGSGSANAVGDIASTVSVNTDAGFSIVSYSGDGNAGATVGHGLSKAPELIIVKRRTGTKSWMVYHAGNTAAPETDHLVLNTTDATADNVAMWNDTAPTADVFSIGVNSQVNSDTLTYVAYCFHSVDGYSKVGSYEGNGDADGPFVYTGFRPEYILLKSSDLAEQWNIFDTARATTNVVDNYLAANDTSDETSTSNADFDILSNGFKLRCTHDNSNGDGHTYIYLAFAETPFKYANAR